MNLFQRIKHWFDGCDKRLLNIMHYRDVSYGYKAPSTYCSYICRTCGKVTTNYHYAVGYLTASDFETKGTEETK